jgi:arsenate reductase
MSVTIYHNPRCTKSRETLELLHKKGIKPVVIEYLKDPPSRKQLLDILARLGMSPRELMRVKETVYQEKKLDNKSLTRDQLIAAMLADPILIERPIVLANGKAAIGRPPENVLQIL